MTEGELLTAVQEALAASENPDGFYRTEEWADMLELSLGAMRLRIKQLLKRKQMERGMVLHEGMNGVTSPVAAYRFIENP